VRASAFLKLKNTKNPYFSTINSNFNSMNSILKIFLATFLVLALGIHSISSRESEKEKEALPETLEQLQAAIEEVLEDTKTPGVGIAMVNADGPLWVISLGKANVEEDRDADENTMFRIGSTSKMFVSLSILKLVEAGKINLNDKIKDLIPEIKWINPWSEDHPVRIAHLLEHTTGWDDIHMVEYAYSPDQPVTLKEGLDFHPHSRTSRWTPGSRMSYCNSGPPVAAYIVEVMTGQKFEDYVQENFFDPMGMENATYFSTETYKELGATLYENGEPSDYWEIVMRPSGSINASPKEMASMVYLFINRGMVNDSVRVIAESSMQRMETPSTTNGAKAGVQHGYGLSNYSSSHSGFKYRGHNGGVNGGLTELAYMPEHKLGYAFMINSGNSSAFGKISDLLRDFQIRNLEKEVIVSDTKLSEEHEKIAGFYEPASPRTQMFYFLSRVMGIQKFWCDNDTVYQAALIGDAAEWYLPSVNGQYKSPESGLIHLALVEDPLVGLILQNGSRTLKPVSAVVVYTRLFMMFFWLLLIPVTLVLALIWGIRYFMGQVASGPNVAVRLWPLLATVFILIAFITLQVSALDPIMLLSNQNGLTITTMLCTIGFAATSLWSVWIIIKHRAAELNQAAYWFSALSAVVNLIVTLYLYSHGVIGIQKWA